MSEDSKTDDSSIVPTGSDLPEPPPAGEVDTNEEKVSQVEKKEETAADLLGANIEQVKVRKQKEAKILPLGFVILSRLLTTPKYPLPISRVM